MASMVTAPSPSRSRPPPDPPPSFAKFVVVVRASPLKPPKPPDLSLISRVASSLLLNTISPLTLQPSSFAMFVVVVRSKLLEPPKPPDLSLTFRAACSSPFNIMVSLTLPSFQVMYMRFSISTSSALLYPLDCFGLSYDSPLAIVQPSTAVCSPFIFPAVCSSTFGVFRLCSLPLWQFEGFMSDITIYPENRMFLDCSCLTSFFMELVLPKSLLVLRSSVAGSLVLKIRDISIYVLIKGSTNWCLIASTFVADYVIVKCAFIAVSVSSFRSLYVFYIGCISIFSSSGIEFRGLLYHISCLCVMYAYLYLYISLFSAFVVAVSFAGMALVPCIVNFLCSDEE